MKLVLTDQRRTGVFSEHEQMRFEGGAIYTDTRMTIPAREALEAVSTLHDQAYYYQRPPQDVVAVLAPVLEKGAPTVDYEVALRLGNEPPFPGERPNPDMWLEVDLTPCPKCGAALVWYEAGHVPGYRVCAGPVHHHFLARLMKPQGRRT